MTVIEEDEEISIKIKSSAKKLRTPASSTSNSLADREEDLTVDVQNPKFEEKDPLEETLAGKTLVEVESNDFDDTVGFANEELSTVIDQGQSVYATALTTPVSEVPSSEIIEKPEESSVELTTGSPPVSTEEATASAEKPQAEQEEKIPPPRQGAYTVDFDKFDDPDFNPFESKKAMRNSPDLVDDVPAPKGSYTVDFDKFDDANFNPFESKKAMQNSPTPENQPSHASISTGKYRLYNNSFYKNN